MQTKTISSINSSNKLFKTSTVSQPNFGGVTLSKKAVAAADSFVSSTVQKNSFKALVAGAFAGLAAKIISSKAEKPFEEQTQELQKAELPELTGKLSGEAAIEYEKLKQEKPQVSEGAYAVLKEYKIDPYILSYICDNLNENNERILPELLALNNTGLSIGRALECINKNNNIDAYHYVINKKGLGNTNFYEEGYSKLDRITDVLSKVDVSTQKILPDLLKSPQLFGKENLSGILSLVNAENLKSFGFILNNSSKVENFKFQTGYSYDNTELAKAFLKSVNAGNKELLSILLYSPEIHNDEDAVECLEKLKNEDKEILKNTLNMRNPSFMLDSVFAKSTGVADCVRALSNPEISDIAKKIIKSCVFQEAEMRFTDYSGIEDLCRILNESPKNKNIYKKVLAMKDTQKKHRFTEVQQVTDIVKALSDPNKREITEKLLKIKINNGGDYLIHKCSRTEALELIDNSLDFERIKQLLNVKALKIERLSAFNFSQIAEIASAAKNLSDEDFPIPLVNEKEISKYLKLINTINEIKNGNSDNLSIEDCIEFASKLQGLQFEGMLNNKFDVEKYIKISRKLLGTDKNGINVSKNDSINLFKNVIANKSEVENKIKTFNFAKYGKNGLPLEYSRKNFIADLNSELDLLSEAEQKRILGKLDISLTDNKQGYNGLLNCNDLNIQNPSEAKVKSLCEKFILNNTVKTGDSSMDEMLNSLIKGMPEFVNVIGKQQHGSQDYSVDIHILQVLKNTMLQENFDTLPDADKTAFKFAVLMHDIGKNEGVVDKNHQNTSSAMSKKIMGRYNLPISVKEHIFKLIKSHHWLEEYNTKAKTPEHVSLNFMAPNDYKMGKMMSYADLKSVSNNVFSAFKGALNDNIQKPLADVIQKNNESGVALFTSKIVFKDRIPEVEYKGNKYQVLDFTAFGEDDDVSKLGFAPNTKKSDLRFLVHQADSVADLEKLNYINNIKNYSVISQSFISTKKKNTYRKQHLGVILDSPNTSIINAFNMNQGSGYQKEENDVVRMVTDSYSNMFRKFLPEKAMKALNISPKSYSIIYERIAGKQYLAQIKDDEKFELPERTITGLEVRETFKKVQDELLTSRFSHNEVVTLKPRIIGLTAIVNSLDDISEEFLKYARENNLPIYLLGEN